MNVIKILYSIFIGILFAVLVGVGIAAFYPGPIQPEYPEVTRPIITDEASETDVIKETMITKEEVEYQKKWDVYQEENKIYNRNVSSIAMGFAILALVVSLWILQKVELISNGLLFGGLQTLIYSIIRGFDAESSKYRFAVVAVSFVIALVVGYLKFIKSEQTSKTRKKVYSN